MSAEILAFPRLPLVRARPTKISDLPAGAKALAITREMGTFVVSVRPVANAADRAFRRNFITAEDAREFARRTSIENHRLYQLIIDEVPRGRPSLRDILGDGHPQFDGAA